jgi:hypothetical protein
MVDSVTQEQLRRTELKRGSESQTKTLSQEQEKEWVKDAQFYLENILGFTVTVKRKDHENNTTA